MIKQNITILKLSAYYDEIGDAGKGRIVEDFKSYGIEIVRFAIESINVPEEDESVQRLKKALADKAEMNIMGDDYKTKRTFDTMEKAAGNEGMGGAAMGAGMGFSMGNQMGSMMNQATSGVTNNQQPQQQQAPSQGDNNDPMAKLQQLKQMFDAQLITQEEYDTKKQEILSQM